MFVCVMWVYVRGVGPTEAQEQFERTELLKCLQTKRRAFSFQSSTCCFQSLLSPIRNFFKTRPIFTLLCFYEAGEEPVTL